MQVYCAGEWWVFIDVIILTENTKYWIEPIRDDSGDLVGAQLMRDSVIYETPYVVAVTHQKADEEKVDFTAIG